MSAFGIIKVNSSPGIQEGADLNCQIETFFYLRIILVHYPLISVFIYDVYMLTILR